MFAYFRSPTSWRELTRRTIVDTFADGCPGLAAQLAFYFLLALFPALLFVVALLAHLPIHPAMTDLVDRLQPILPQEIMQLLRTIIQQALTHAHSGILTFAIVGALWSSSSAVTAIIDALNTAYDIQDSRSWLKRRAIAVGVMLAGVLLFLLAGGALLFGPDIARAVGLFGAGA